MLHPSIPISTGRFEVGSQRVLCRPCGGTRWHPEGCQAQDISDHTVVSKLAASPDQRWVMKSWWPSTLLGRWEQNADLPIPANVNTD